MFFIVLPNPGFAGFDCQKSQQFPFRNNRRRQQRASADLLHQPRRQLSFQRTLRFTDPNYFFPAQSLIKFAQVLDGDARSGSARPAQSQSNLAVADSAPKIAPLSLEPINISARRLEKFKGSFRTLVA